MVTYEKYCEYRDLKGMKDIDVARKAEIPPSLFSEWKKGKSRPKEDKMIKIANALEMDYSEFIGINSNERDPHDDALLKKYHAASPEIRELIDHALKLHQQKP